MINSVLDILTLPAILCAFKLCHICAISVSKNVRKYQYISKSITEKLLIDRHYFNFDWQTQIIDFYRSSILIKGDIILVNF